MNTQQYFQQLEKDVRKVYVMAEEARAVGLDSQNKIEIPLAMSMAEKVVSLIATKYAQMEDSKIAERILELEKEHGKLDVLVAFKIAEEIAKQKFCKFVSLIEAIDAGIRVGFAYLTLGVVSSPLEGYTGLKLRKTREGRDYFEVSFSGPIRSAGTTASCVVLMLIDYLREMFGYAKYDPTEDEIKRTYAELYDFHDRIANLQYMPTKEEALFLARNIPIQIAGDASEKLEVSNYKNLSRVDTNYLRSGFCLIIGEGLAQKAKKGLRMLNRLKKKGFKTTGFDFLKDYIELHEKRDLGETEDSPTYIKDLVAGRPVFGHPSRSGAFRFRYGRGRVSGFSAASVHPATMAITDGFIATGTQLKIEKPTKGVAVTICDSIDGPIVKLFNGSVRQIKTKEEAKKVYSDVEEIIYLGDLLFPFSDIVNRNANLIKPGYVEEWWNLDLLEKAPNAKVDYFNVDFNKATELSEKYGIPLHPNFIFYWTQISKEQFLGLINWLKNSIVREKIIFPFNSFEQEKFKIGKRALELLGVEHDVTIENVVLTEENSKSLFVSLGIDLKIFEKGGLLKDFFDEKKFNLNKSVLGSVNSLSHFEIKDKAGEFIGARMGRPEKAKLRKLTGSPNVLFPVGKEGGRLRSIQAACEAGKVWSTFPIYYCETCKKETIYPLCETCGNTCKKMYYCRECEEKSLKPCLIHQKNPGAVQRFCNFELDINYYFESARNKIGFSKADVPLLIKGVRGTSSSEHTMEPLAKGLLRAAYNLQVNKDGTIRFDATELPLVSFKPKEVGVGVKKLKELGYDHDIYGEELVSEGQIIELMPHDILLPSVPESQDERGDEVFAEICNFVDEELEKFYGLKSFYNLKKREDLIGKLGVCMAPHNCAGVICRFVGFANTLGLFASPYMHAAIRRDCDGDEASIMLLGDVLLNFSRDFLPNHRGGTQDAPLVLNAKIDAGEVDDQILDFEFVEDSYPIELYRLAEQGKHSSEVKIETVKTRLKEGKSPFVGFGFTHNVSNFTDGVVCSSYKLLATMQEKVQHQMELVEKIRAVDTFDTARLIIERHFIRDLRGNLRKFSAQEFRCVGCNEIMRRPPLKGVCPKCGGKIIFTIHEGGIKKYLEPALNLAKAYDLSPYVKQTLQLIKENIDSIFGKELEKQEALGKWF